MKKKSEFTILERAMQTVEGFDKVYHKMKQQTILGGRSHSTLENYSRRIALVCLEFNRLPEDIFGRRDQRVPDRTGSDGQISIT
jgi:hypothetical protein